MPSRTTYPTVDQHKAELAAEAWAPLIDFIVATGPRRSHVFGELGLTPNDGRALGSLDPVTGRSMRSLADEWGCDASTATWAIDRLVAKGLAERRAHDRDRRITLVTLTAAGDETAPVVPAPDLAGEQTTREIGAARAVLGEGVDDRVTAGELEEVGEVCGTEHVHSLPRSEPGQGHIREPTRIRCLAVRSALSPATR